MYSYKYKLFWAKWLLIINSTSMFVMYGSVTLKIYMPEPNGDTLYSAYLSPSKIYFYL